MRHDKKYLMNGGSTGRGELRGYEIANLRRNLINEARREHFWKVIVPCAIYGALTLLLVMLLVANFSMW